MNVYTSYRDWRQWLLLSIFLPVLAFAQPPEPQFAGIQLAVLVADEKTPLWSAAQSEQISPRSSWALAIDNDILTPPQRDQDYTYGFNLTYTGVGARDFPLSLDRPLATVDRWLGVDKLSPKGVTSHSIEAGLFGFTPEDIEVAEANPDDRPYASLVYVASAREQVDFDRQVAWKSTLALGVLGLDLVGDLQNVAHQVTEGREARGWQHQISDGGELTARYAIARQRHLGHLGSTEFKSTLQASVGYLTETSWSVSFRSGKYHTLWSSFNPELASYGEKSAYTTGVSAVNERYFWGGVTFKARAYNAFLQGQFRDSAVTIRSSDLRPLLVEAWVGYTLAFSEGYRVSYVLRGHSSEIRSGAGDRSLVWGGLILARTFD